MRRLVSLAIVLFLLSGIMIVLIEGEDSDALPARADPVISNGGVFSPLPAPVTGNYTFHITYTDADGDAPFLGDFYVYVDAVSYKLTSDDTSYTTGANFTKTISGFESGIHRYFFSLLKEDWEGNIYYPGGDPYYNYLTFEVPGTYSTPKLNDAKWDPYNSGVDQPINFSVTYKDLHGHAPKYVQIRFDNGEWTNMTVEGTDYVNGVNCWYTTSFPSISYHYFHIRTEDSTNLSREIGSYSFNVQNGQPELFNGGVTPSTGDADKTDFTFFVHYKDWEGDIPYYVMVEVSQVVTGNGTGEYLTMSLDTMDGPYNSTHYKNGVNFSGSMKLLTGDFNYRFYTRSGYNNIYYPDDHFLTINTTGWRHKPYLTDLTFSPKTGNEDTVFNLSVYYFDEDNSPPVYVNISYNGLVFSLTPHGKDYRNGTLCSIRTKLPSDYTFLVAYAMDTQNLWSLPLYSDENLRVTGTGEPGLLDNAWVTPNPGDASIYTPYHFYIDYVHPVNYSSSMYAKNIQLILDGESYLMNFDEHKSDTTIIYHDRINNLEPGIYKWHVEGLDYGYREMRYPETGELKLEVFEDIPNIVAGSVYPMEGTDLEKFTFNLTVYNEWDDNASIKQVDAYVIIDDIVYSMNNIGSPSDLPELTNFQYRSYLTAGEHRVYFKAEYKGEGYATNPQWISHYSVIVEGHNELLGRNVIPQTPFDDDILNFTIVYKDTGGLEASYMRIFIDNEVHNMTAAPGNVTLGRVFYFGTKLTAGNHTYWFEVMGRNTTLRSPEIGSYYTVHVREKVILNYPILIDQTLSPSTGTDSTTFKFGVTYRHPDGYSPGHVNIIIDGGAHMMSIGTGYNFTAGMDYSYSTKLGAGTHVYYFHANDSLGREVRYPATGVYTIDVTSGQGNGDSTPPVALIYHTTGALSVSLDGTSSYDPDGNIVHYYWVVNGASYTGSIQNITFNDPGYITASLTVTDNDGVSDTAIVNFWVTSTEGSSSGNNDVGGVMEVSEGGQGTVIETEDGTSISLDDVGEGGASFSFDSNSTDPRVIVLDVSKEAISLSYGEDAKVRIDGIDIQEAESLEDVIGATGENPLYYIVRSGDTYRVMVYLPDPSDVDDIDIIVTGDSDTSDQEDDDTGYDWFLIIIIIISLILAMIVIVLVLARRGPEYDGIPEEDEEDYEEDMDFDLISSTKRNTYRQFMEE